MYLCIHAQRFTFKFIFFKQDNSPNSLKHFADDMSGPLSPMSVPAPKQLKYTAGIANGSVRDSAAFMDQTRKVDFLLMLNVSIGSLFLVFGK